MIVKIKKILFWTAVAFIVLVLLSLTFGQVVPYEFADTIMIQNYYDIIMQGFPLAIAMTLFGTLKPGNSKGKNLTFLGLTALASILSFVTMVNLMFKIGFGVWTTESTLYRHKTQDKMIQEQTLDVGAFGYGGQRIVEIRPILKYWILPIHIDTSTINKNEWELVNENSNIKFP